jgi:rhodanese-related sulfurtransferase
VRLPGALHLTADRLESSLDKLPRDKEIVIYCA